MKTGEKREVGADAKVDPVGKDLGVKAGQSGELGAPTVAKTRVAKPTETDATRAETSGPGNQSRQRKDLSVKSQGSQKPDGEGKEKAAGKKGSVPKKGLADKKELIEEKSGKAIESDRVSDAGSDRASVHSLSRFSDVGSDPMTSAGDVSGRFGLAASLSRVAAWREKRNWVDHLALVSSPRRADGRRAESGRKLDGKAANRTESRAEAEPNGSRNRGDGSGADEWGSEGGVATKERVPGSVPLIPADKRAGSAERAKMLHDKLMSPERRKKTPSETREKVRTLRDDVFPTFNNVVIFPGCEQKIVSANMRQNMRHLRGSQDTRCFAHQVLGEGTALRLDC